MSKRGNVAFYISGDIDSDLNAELSYLSNDAKVYAPGQIPYKNNIQIVGSCDFGISPTLIENLSNAIIEGLFLNVPFVTFNVGGNVEIIKDGVNGFIVPYLDIDTLIDKAVLLIEDRQILKMMKNKTSSIINNIVNNDLVLKKYQEVFDFLLGNSKTIPQD